jgi:zinc transporter 1/2/3
MSIKESTKNINESQMENSYITMSANTKLETQVEDDDKIDTIIIPKKSCTSNFTPFVLMIGLGTHAVFEGLALGIVGTEEKAFIFALAIALHKGAEGISLGISMQKTFPDDKRFVTYMLILFALFSPIGVGIGMLLEDTNEMIEIIFSSLAAGTFMYISMSEVIVEEFSDPKHKITKLFFFITGIVLITCLGFLEE